MTYKGDYKRAPSNFPNSMIQENVLYIYTSTLEGPLLMAGPIRILGLHLSMIRYSEFTVLFSSCLYSTWKHPYYIGTHLKSSDVRAKSTFVIIYSNPLIFTWENWELQKSSQSK